MPNAERAYRIGKSGNGLAILYAVLLIASIVGMTAATLSTTAMHDVIIIVVISLVLFFAPLVIYAFKKPSWKERIDADLKK